MGKERKMKQRIIWTIVLTIIFMLSLWCIDISVTAMNLGGLMTNGFTGLISPTQTYHVGLCFAIVTFFIMSLMTIRSDKHENNK